MRHITSLAPADCRTTITLEPARPAQQAQGPRGPRRHADQLPRHRPAAPMVTGLGREAPTVMGITNDDQIKTRALVRPVRPPDDHRAAARRDHPRVSAPTPSPAPVNLNVDLDVMLAVSRPGPHRRPARPAPRLRDRDPRHHPAAVPPETPSGIITAPDTITVRLERRAFSPVLRKADLPRRHPRPLVRRTHHPLRNHLNVAPNLLCGNRR